MKNYLLSAILIGLGFCLAGVSAAAPMPLDSLDNSSVSNTMNLSNTIPSTQLFKRLNDTSLVSPLSDDPMLQTLYEENSALSVEAITVNTQLIDGSTNVLRLPLGKSDSTAVRMTKSYWLNNQYQAWTGEVQLKSLQRYRGKNPNRAVFVRSGERIFGQIQFGKTTYELMTMENGQHVLVERDFSQLGIGDDTPDVSFHAEEAEVAAPLSTISMAAVSTVRVLQIASTTLLNRRGTRNVVDRMNFFIAQANDVYANNGIPLVVQDAGKFNGGRGELSSVSSNLSALRNSRDGYLDSFLGSTRNSRAADIIAYITDNNGDSLCGQAGSIGGGASSAVFVTRYVCTGLTFVHEIGHLFGARHDNDPTRTPFAYGHGFVNREGNFRTVMAVSSNPQPRIGLFSTDDQTFRGRSLGNRSFRDNERVHVVRASTVAAFR